MFALKTHFETNFVVMPRDCNYMTPLIFGGEFFAQLDLAAASCVSQLLQFSDSPCDNAVTHKANVTFTKPSYMGDLIFIECDVVELRHRGIGIKVKAYRQPRDIKYPERQHVADVDFVFVSRLGDVYTDHGLSLG